MASSAGPSCTWPAPAWASSVKCRSVEVGAELGGQRGPDRQSEAGERGKAGQSGREARGRERRQRRGELASSAPPAASSARAVSCALASPSRERRLRLARSRRRHPPRQLEGWSVEPPIGPERLVGDGQRGVTDQHAAQLVEPERADAALDRALPPSAAGARTRPAGSAVASGVGRAPGRAAPRCRATRQGCRDRGSPFHPPPARDGAARPPPPPCAASTWPTSSGASETETRQAFDLVEHRALVVDHAQPGRGSTRPGGRRRAGSPAIRSAAPPTASRVGPPFPLHRRLDAMREPGQRDRPLRQPPGERADAPSTSRIATPSRTRPSRCERAAGVASDLSIGLSGPAPLTGRRCAG